MKRVSKLDEYLFDLNGYLIIENALNKKELKDLNKIIDKLKNLKIMNGQDMFMVIIMVEKMVLIFNKFMKQVSHSKN